MSIYTLPKPETVEERFSLVRSVGEECTMDSELMNLIAKKPCIRCYDGFEPSGRMHIAQGILKAINVNKCTASGCKFIFWVADWFALMNDKMGGRIDRIHIVGKYLVEVWKAAGMDMDNVEFKWSSSEINENAEVYWLRVIDIARRNTLARIKKCCTIMGKQEDILTAAQIMYPLMQCADVFFLKADICQLGVDQRKVNMLAREYCDQIKQKLKPVILSHHMLAGLKAGQAKMSKSDKESAIFMEDTEEDVTRKIMNAHCPRIAQDASEVTDDGLPVGSDDTNPCLDYLRYIVFSQPSATFTAGDVTYATYEDAERAFVSMEVSEEDLKRGLVKIINTLLEPVRAHFHNNADAKALLETIKGFAADPVDPSAANSKEDNDNDNSPKRIVVFVPAVSKLQMDIVISTVLTVNTFLNENSDAEGVVYLPDWYNMARNEITGDAKDIAAALEFNVCMLKAYGISDRVKIMWQHKVILESPNDYWVSVINIGRKYRLSSIEKAVGGDITNSGQVIGALMRVADVKILSATHILSLDTDMGQHELACEYLGDKCVIVRAASGKIIPKLCDPASQATGELDYLYSDDNEMELSKKIKKAFAAEGNPSNPVVAIGESLLTLGLVTELKIKDMTVTTAEELRNAYMSGEVHPGDLKAVIKEKIMLVSERARAASTTPEMKKLTTVLRNAEKKLAKK